MIDCKSIVNEIKENLKPLVTTDKALAIIQVGDNPSSNIYVKNKIKDCNELGVRHCLYHFNDDVTEEELLNLIYELNSNQNIKGIIVQLPIPKHLNTDKITNAIADEKDVDGFKVTSKYTPATPKGVMTILDNVVGDLSGKTVCLVGKGKTVGMPLIPLLLERGATLTVCHSRTKKEDLEDLILYSDIIISAVGKPNTIVKDMFYVGCYRDGRPYYCVDDKVIIDVGISRDENGKQIGDCERELHDIAENITPYTNGVGLMTRVSLLQNLLKE